MNAISQPFTSYIARDEAIRIAQNKPVRIDESHSALVASGFQAILTALMINGAAMALMQPAQPKIEPRPT